MAYSQRDWEVVKAFFEQGLSLGQIVARKECAITDKSTISKKAKAEGWVKGKNSMLVEKEVQLKQLDKEVFEEKSTLNSIEVEMLNIIVHEKTQHIAFFANKTLANCHMMMEKITKASPIEHHAIAQRTLKDGRETVLGKEAPATNVQVNNVQAVTPREMTDEELIEILNS